jgi:hypothetical protein
MQCDRHAPLALSLLGIVPPAPSESRSTTQHERAQPKTDHQHDTADLYLPRCLKGPIPHHHLFPEPAPLRRLELDLSELGRPFLQKSSDAFLAIRKRKTAIIQSPFDLEPRAQRRRLGLLLSARHLPAPGATYQLSRPAWQV